MSNDGSSCGRTMANGLNRLLGVDFIGPVAQTGGRIGAGDRVEDVGQRVSPVDHGPGVGALDHADVRVATLLVRHRLAAALHASPCLVELVVVPDAFFGHPVRDVTGAAPEDEADRQAVEPHHHVGQVADPPGRVPLGIELQPRVEGAEGPLAAACHRPPNCQEPNGPDLDERILYFSMSPNQAIFTDTIICSSPIAAAHPLTVLSWPRRSTSVASGVPARWP